MTLNRRDFRPALSRVTVFCCASRTGFLAELNAEGSDMAAVLSRVQARRRRAVSGREQPLRPLLKRAGLPRLGKALAAGPDTVNEKQLLKPKSNSYLL